MEKNPDTLACGKIELKNSLGTENACRHTLYDFKIQIYKIKN